VDALFIEWLSGDEKLVNIFDFAMQNLSWSRTNQARDGETENTGRKHLYVRFMLHLIWKDGSRASKGKQEVLFRSSASRSEAAEVVSLFSLHE
jgi:hypothetical protein